MESYYNLKRWEQAKEFIEKYNLEPFIAKIKQKIEEYGFKYKLYYELDYDHEDPIEKLEIYVKIDTSDIDEEIYIIVY